MKTTLLLCFLGAAYADLRMAAQPKKAFNLLQQNGGNNAKNFRIGTGLTATGQTNNNAKGTVLYMEPSTFGYTGLVNQRANNYDNFLRSNIDNEQDNRNFNNEAGLDHLPFRTFESAVDTQYPHKGTDAASNKDDSLQVNNVNVQTVLRTQPGEARITPLRWNNPHAAELEVNLWIMCADPPAVVPVKKPSCSGEGNQNNVVQWAIPEDFNQQAWGNCPATSCFTGCNVEGDCVLQIYAHSVETRQYSTSAPIIIAKTSVPYQLPYTALPRDAVQSNNYQWPKNFDLKSMIAAEPTSNANNNNGGNLQNLALCVSSATLGVDINGQEQTQLQLIPNAQTAQSFSSPTLVIYLCKMTAEQQAAESSVDRVVFSVTGAAPQTENYTPFEISSDNDFGGTGLKQISAVVTSGSTTVTLSAQLDLTVNKRWRFRRHLQTVCPTGVLTEPMADPWLDLSKLKRETCLSAQDANSNYKYTKVQRATLHSDVANHAYQNSNYSPYSGQQHAEISRNLQAAAVIHMTASNRGELGQNNIPAELKATAAQLNNQVNQLYQAYEKVANKVIDAVTKAGGTNGGNVEMGVQDLGESFRASEKGATSTKRLKTTTYVPSFSSQGYDQAVLQKALARNSGRNGQLADLLSTPKAGSNEQFIQIYQSTMNKMLPAFAAAAPKGVTYMESVKMVPCTTVQQQSPNMLAMAKGYLSNTQTWAATACCQGSMQNTARGGCGATLTDVTKFNKRNANGNKDGGQFAAQQFSQQRNMMLYGCSDKCMNIAANANKANLAKPLTKTSAGTCLHYLGAAGCTTTNQANSVDCRACAGAFNNVQPKAFSAGFTSPGAPGNLDSLVNRIQAEGAQSAESLSIGNVLRTADDPLAIDDTAACFTKSKFTCPGTDLEYAAMVSAGKCSETEAAKKDGMCDDSPCDNDPDSDRCQRAKANCEVDPDSGVFCMPAAGDNNPCAGCIRSSDDAAMAAFSVGLLVTLASVLL